MKEIQTRELKEKKSKRNRLIVGLILVVIMVFSTAGYAFYNTSRTSDENQNKLSYNGFEFILTDNGFWQTNIGNTFFYTQFNPEETENISVPIFITLNNYASNPIFFSHDSDKTSINEIMQNIQPFVLRSQLICLKSETEGMENERETETCEENLPVKNCTNANGYVIAIKESNKTKISQDNLCVFIEAPYADSELTKATDAFIFKILGIRQ